MWSKGLLNRGSGKFSIQDCRDSNSGLYNNQTICATRTPDNNVDLGINHVNDNTRIPSGPMTSVRIASWNIRGISDKLSDQDLQKHLQHYGIIILYETMKDNMYALDR